MARDAVSVTYVTKHTAVNTPSGVAINTTNGANITGFKKARKILLRITNKITNATKTATIKAGAYPPGATSGLGDLALVVPQSGDILVTLEHARFVQTDGSINVDYSTGMTGALSVFEIPWNV